MKDAFAQTSQGRIHYLHAGAGTPLILLHSNGCSAHEFAANFARLARSFHVIAWDMPGHGDSDPLTRHMSIAAYADALVALLDQLSIERAHVLGASIGALIAAELAARFPHRVRSAMVVEAPIREESVWEAHWPMVEAMFTQTTQGFDEVAPRFKCLSAQCYARWNIDRNKAGGKTMMDVMWAGRQYDLLQSLGKMQAETLLVFGDKGPVFDSLPLFREHLPKAHIATMAGCGHFPMVDEPEQFDAIVLDFLLAQA